MHGFLAGTAPVIGCFQVGFAVWLFKNGQMELAAVNLCLAGVMFWNAWRLNQ